MSKYVNCIHRQELATGGFKSCYRADASWYNKLCVEHGFKTPTKEQLFKLIAELNGWGDQSSRVTFGFMPMRVHTAQDDSHLDYNNWGWVASTGVINGKDVGAQGESLEEALWNLAQAIGSRKEQLAAHYKSDHQNAGKKLDSFKNMMHEFPNPPKEGPYR